MRGSASRPGRSLPRERHSTHCRGGAVGPRAGLDRCGKSCPHRDSIPGPSSPLAVAIPTTIPYPLSFRIKAQYSFGWYWPANIEESFVTTLAPFPCTSSKKAECANSNMYIYIYCILYIFFEWHYVLVSSGILPSQLLVKSVLVDEKCWFRALTFASENNDEE